MNIKPKRPTSPARAAASRANGAKSRGPRTLRGKYNSSLNGLRHGLHAQIHILPGERPDLFQELFHSFHEDLRPSTPVQRALTEKLVMSWWKTQRVWGHEATRIAQEINKGLASTAIPADTHSAVRGALAVAEIMKQDRTIEFFSRAESRYERHFYRALKQLRELKSLPPDFDSDDDTPNSPPPVPAPILVTPDPPPPPPAAPQSVPAATPHSLPSRDSNAAVAPPVPRRPDGNPPPPNPSRTKRQYEPENPLKTNHRDLRFPASPTSSRLCELTPPEARRRSAPGVK